MNDIETKRIKVLLVDDEKDIIDLLDNLMRMVGIDSVSARDGEEGWEKFVHENPDAVVSDIAMPRMNGIDLLEKIKQSAPNVPVILVTGYGEYQKMLKEKFLQCEGFLNKPIDLKRILEILSDYFPQINDNMASLRF